MALNQPSPRVAGETTAAVDESRPRVAWRILAVVMLVSLLFLAILGYSFRSGHQMVSKYTPLIDAAMEIRLEATLAHLWLEEILSGDESESIDGVLQHIDNALWYARAMLSGGRNEEGVFESLEQTEMRDEIHQVIEQLVRLRSIYALHVGEELWRRLGHEESLAYAPWPEWGESVLHESTTRIAVQISETLRGLVEVAEDAPEEEILAPAKTEASVARHLEGKSIVKEVYFPGRIVNLVVRTVQ